MTTSAGDHKALILLRDDPTRFANQGTIVPSWRTYRGRRLGPYYRLVWRENGRQRSIYLGRQGPVVRQVRLLLHKAQTIRRIKREHRRNTRLFRENVIRPLKEYVKEMFRLFGNGLYVKGSDIGGIKTAGPRLTTADVPEHLIPKFPLPMPSFLAEMSTQHNTNPKRDRGQQTPSPNTPPKHQPRQETSHLHTNPKRERGQQTHFPNTCPKRQRPHQAHSSPSPPPSSPAPHSPEVSQFVGQNNPHQRRPEPDFLKLPPIVDQNIPRLCAPRPPPSPSREPPHEKLKAHSSKLKDAAD